MFSSFNREENGREGDKPALLSTDREGKSLSRKSLRKPSSFPCSKRLRTGQTNHEATVVEADNHESLSSMKTGYDHFRCVSDDKCRIVKQKRGQDVKRIDKKSFKASVKTKFDAFTSKTGFISSDLASGGIDTIGIYGLKSELNDLTKHVEELSLNELLDGSYTNPNLLPEKGKKVSNGNDNVFLSVQKACSILPLCAATENGGNRKPLTSLQNPCLSLANMSDRDENDKCCKELSSKDSRQAKFSTSTLYQPKDILEQLAFPPTMDLETFIMNLNSSQCTMHLKAFNTGSLPPFSWSFSHGGTCRPGVDFCKLTLPRSGSQSKWVRMKSGSTSSGGGNSCFSGLEGKTVNHNDEFANKQKIELLEDVRSLIESITPLFDGPQDISESHRSDVSGSLNSRNLEALDGHAETSDNHEEDDLKQHLFSQNSESEVGLRCLRNNLVDSSQFDSQCKDIEIDQKGHPRGTIDDCSQSCNVYPSESFPEGCGRGLRHSPAPELSKPGHSPQLLAAAAILWEMASNTIKAQNDAGVRIKSPASRKHIKDWKSTSDEKQERLFLAYRHHDTFKRPAPPSTRHKLISEKKTDFVHSNNLGKESDKWLSGEVGDAPPGKLERDRVRTNHVLLHGNSMRPSSLMHSPIRVEKVYDSHLKLGKETLKGPSIGFGENYIKDWSRGRSKRV